MTTTASRKALLLAATLFVSVALLPGLYILNELSKPTTVHIGLTTDGESSLKVCVPAARYIAPAVLRDMNDAGVIEHTARGLPKIIHQSWLDLDLPVKFKHWSDSFRMKHPDWVWVMWTDEDNARLVDTRFAHLADVYRSLRSDIQRADFARNLYMWEYGGLYADLDMECLRPMDDILDFPHEYASPTYPAEPSIPLDINDQSPMLAYIGSMEVGDGWLKDHGLPNAFMASRPRHPLWLVTLSHVTKSEGLRRSSAQNSDDEFAAESTTGPIAMMRAVERYRSMQRLGTPVIDMIDPLLHDMGSRAGNVHNLVVFDTGVIYPFSWASEMTNIRAHKQSPESVERISLQHCLAQKGSSFNAEQCIKTVKAFERKAHAITYWSHTWKQSSSSKSLAFVGAA